MAIDPPTVRCSNDDSNTQHVQLLDEIVRLVEQSSGGGGGGDETQTAQVSKKWLSAMRKLTSDIVTPTHEAFSLQHQHVVVALFKQAQSFNCDLVCLSHADCWFGKLAHLSKVSVDTYRGFVQVAQRAAEALRQSAAFVSLSHLGKPRCAEKSAAEEGAKSRKGSSRGKGPAPTSSLTTSRRRGEEPAVETDDDDTRQAAKRLAIETNAAAMRVQNEEGLEALGVLALTVVWD